jgi:hypothetical protein
MPRQPRQPPRPNKIPISDLRTEDECDAYIKAEAIYLRKHSRERYHEGHAVNASTSYICSNVILAVLKRKAQISADNRAAEIAASDPNDEPATTVFVGQDGTVGISK